MKNIWSQVSWLRTAVAAALGVIAGGLLIFIGIQFPEKWYGVLLSHLGSIVIASVALVLIFEYWQKDALFREFFRFAKSADQLQAARITGFSSTFQDLVPWEDLFEKSTRLDILFAYGASWRGTHGHRIDTLLSRDRARLGVILPDPENEHVVRDLASRFNTGSDTIRGKIGEAIAFFRGKRAAFPDKVDIYLTSKTMTYTFYRFNNEAVIALYRYRDERGGVPTFIVERGGELYEFVRSEWYGLTEKGIGTGALRRVE